MYASLFLESFFVLLFHFFLLCFLSEGAGLNGHQAGPGAHLSQHPRPRRLPECRKYRASECSTVFFKKNGPGLTKKCDLAQNALARFVPSQSSPAANVILARRLLGSSRMCQAGRDITRKQECCCCSATHRLDAMIVHTSPSPQRAPPCG